MRLNITTTATRVAVDSSFRPLLQNRGPASVFVDRNPDVTTADGVEIAAGGSLTVESAERCGGGALYVISTAEGADLRVMRQG